VRELIEEGLRRQIELSAELDLDHDRSDDLLVLLNDPRDAAAAQPAVDRLRGLGLDLRTVTADEARTIEPALNPAAPLHSAVFLRGPAVANCREWTMLMRHRVTRLGGTLHLRTGVNQLRPDGGAWRVSATDGSEQRFDAVVLCAGVDADGLLAHLGLPTPWTVLWSHSLSAGVREPMDAPVSAVLDLRTRIAITRLGQRVRAAGGTDLGGSAAGTDPASLRRLGQVLSHWFPAAARFSGPQASVQSWRGALVMSDDGLPVIGASRLPGLWLNLAHGAAGWAMACGAARLLAGAISSPPPAGEPTPFSPSRLGL
jgi:D-amino-acid dehydrogenase